MSTLLITCSFVGSVKPSVLYEGSKFSTAFKDSGSLENKSFMDINDYYIKGNISSIDVAWIKLGNSDISNNCLRIKYAPKNSSDRATINWPLKEPNNNGWNNSLKSPNLANISFPITISVNGKGLNGDEWVDLQINMSGVLINYSILFSIDFENTYYIIFTNRSIDDIGIAFNAGKNPVGATIFLRHINVSYMPNIQNNERIFYKPEESSPVTSLSRTPLRECTLYDSFDNLDSSWKKSYNGPNEETDIPWNILSRNSVSSPHSLSTGGLMYAGHYNINKSVIGPGNVSFFWKKSKYFGEIGTELYVLIDGRRIVTYKDPTFDWEKVDALVFGPGKHEISWIFEIKEPARGWKLPRPDAEGWIDDIKICETSP